MSKKKKQEYSESEIRKLQKQNGFLTGELIARNRQNEILEGKVNEYKKIIDKFVVDNQSFSSIAHNIAESYQIREKITEQASREYYSIHDNINEVRKYLLEIYRILQKYDLYRIETET